MSAAKSFRVNRRELAVCLLLFVITSVLLGLLFYRAIELKTIEYLAADKTLIRAVDFVIGATIGATMAHFVIDAGAWRLSRSLQRTYIGKRFAFVFGEKSKELV